MSGEETYNLDIMVEEARFGGKLSWPQWTDLLARCDEPDRGWISEAFAAAVDGDLNRIAGRIVYEARVNKDQFYPDAVSVVLQEFTVMVNQAAAGELEGVLSPAAVLKVRASRAFSHFLGSSSGFMPASGMVMLGRRRDQIHQTRMQLRADLGREPEDSEVIDATNERMRANRSDPEKQGALVGPDDLLPIAPAVAFDPELVNHTRNGSGGDDSAIDTTMRKTLARMVLASDQANSSRLHHLVAKFIWEHHLLDVPPPPVNTRDLRAHFPDEDPKVLNRLFALFQRDLPKELLAEKFGVHGIT